MIQPPAQGDNVDQLWKIVVELTAAVNTLSGLTVTGAVKGKLVMSGGTAVIVIEQKTDPSSINSA
jgi:hypothetical protein